MEVVVHHAVGRITTWSTGGDAGSLIKSLNEKGTASDAKQIRCLNPAKERRQSCVVPNVFLRKLDVQPRAAESAGPSSSFRYVSCATFSCRCSVLFPGILQPDGIGRHGYMLQ